MTHTHRSGVAGVGAAVLVLFGGGLWVACAPGSLPCEKQEWKMACAEQPGGGAGSGGSSGSGGGGGGSGGSSGSGGSTGGSGGSGAGGSGGGSGGPVTAQTVVQNCSMFDTLGKMDMFFEMRCGVDMACHAPNAPWTDFKTGSAFMRLLDTKPKIACTNGKLLDKANWQNSVLLFKVKNPGMCPPGTGTTLPGLMPPAETAQAINPKQPQLSAAEVACVEGFIKAATGN
jgi:hypothetical protein